MAVRWFATLDPALLVQLSTLEVGDFFRSDDLNGDLTYGTLLMVNSCRTRVRVAGKQRQVVSIGDGGRASYQQTLPDSEAEENWPLTTMVEPITEHTLHNHEKQREPSMEQTQAQIAVATGLQAKYDYQLKQLVKAEADGDVAKVEVAKSRLTALQTEAEQKEVKLRRETAQPAKPAAVAGDAKPAAKVAAPKPAAKPAKVAAPKTKTEAKKDAAPKKLQSTHNCICGCGRECGGLYAPGHDASVKSLLLKVERGQMATTAINEVLGAFVQYKGKHGTDGYRLVKAPVKFPGRDDVENTSLLALEALDV